MDDYISRLSKPTLMEGVIETGLLDSLLNLALKDLGERVLNADSENELKLAKSHFDGAKYFAEKVRLIATEIAQTSKVKTTSVQFDS